MKFLSLKSLYLKLLLGNDQIRKHHVTMTSKEAFVSNNLQRQSHFPIFDLKKNPFFQLPVFYLNDPASWVKTLLLPGTNSLVPTMWTLENVNTDLVEFLFKNDSNHFGVKLKEFKKDDDRGLCLGQNLTKGVVDFNLSCAWEISRSF